MPNAIKTYVRWVDAASWYTGLFAMYLIFALLGILVYASVMKVFFLPSNWTVEMARASWSPTTCSAALTRFKTEEHVRMDLLYGGWPVRKKAKFDLVTDLTMIFFLPVLLFGGIASSYYAYEYAERSSSTWRPYMLPVKLVMTFGIFLTLSAGHRHLLQGLGDG